MRFEIPFDNKIYKKQIELLFKIEWGDIAKENRKTLFYGIGSLLFSLFILYNEKYLGFLLFFSISLYFLINYYIFFKLYTKTKDLIFKNMEEKIIENKEIENNSVWIFENDYFFNSFDGIESKYNWNKFDRFEIIEDTLITYFSKSSAHGFVISIEEIGKEKFDEIIYFIQTKLTKL